MATPTQLQLDIVLAGLAPARGRRSHKTEYAKARLCAIGNALRQAWAAWQRRMCAADTYHALSGLDARTLRDLGLDHSELASLAAELAGDAEPTRVHARRHIGRR